MKAAIIGSRGIPNRYGGFEQFAEYLSTGLVERGMEVWVYCSDKHAYRKNNYRGVNLIHCTDPEDRLGTAGQFIYDLNCIFDSRKRDFDVILQLGYTSSTIWHRLLPRKARIITNMDGLEWKRSKYSSKVRRFLRYAERLAVKSSDALVADSEAIRSYLTEEYNAESTYIPYGAVIPSNPDPELLKKLHVEPGRYFLLIARMQPDNHIEEAIKGVLKSGSEFPLIVVGNTDNRHGRYLLNNYRSEKIVFTGGVFDLPLLDSMRHHCRLYFHGHSAGGTNPSLLEAMAASAPVCAHDNPFNRSVLGEDAQYFHSLLDVASIIKNEPEPEWRRRVIENNILKILHKYQWDGVIDDYLKLIQSSVLI